LKLEDCKNASGKWVFTKTIDGVQYQTVGGSIWNSMCSRCIPGGSYQRKKPTYVGVTHTFKDCHDFIEWARQQVGYGLTDYQLDKDFLIKGNKVYSKETCVFIPSRLNALLTKSNAQRGKWPLGVTFEQDRQKFTAYLSYDGSGPSKRLGSFDTPDEAFVVYKASKEALIKSLAEQYRHNVDARVYEAMLKYEVSIDD
jgi:hypothetical protein